MSEDARTIKTPITESGVLELDGRTGLGSLAAIGAICATARMEQFDEVIQTDAKGLGMLHNDADCALNAIFSYLEAIGDLLAYADTRELNERTLTDLGWLMMTFGEMGCQLQNARQLIEENITRVREEGREAA